MILKCSELRSSRLKLHLSDRDARQQDLVEIHYVVLDVLPQWPLEAELP